MRPLLETVADRVIEYGEIDDAVPTRALAERRAVAVDVLAVAESRHVPRQRRCSRSLRSISGRSARLLPSRKQEIEGEVDKFARATLVHRGLQAAEDRRAIGVEGAELAADIGRLHPERAQRLYRGAVAMRPVEAVSRD